MAAAREADEVLGLKFSPSVVSYRLAWRLLHCRSRRVSIDGGGREENEQRGPAGRDTRIEQFLQKGKIGDSFNPRHIFRSQRNCAPAKVKNDIKASECSWLCQKRGALKAVASLARKGHHLRLG